MHLETDHENSLPWAAIITQQVKSWIVLKREVTLLRLPDWKSFLINTAITFIVSPRQFEPRGCNKHPGEYEVTRSWRFVRAKVIADFVMNVFPSTDIKDWGI